MSWKRVEAHVIVSITSTSLARPRLLQLSQYVRDSLHSLHKVLV